MSDIPSVDECVLLTRSPYAAHADLRAMMRDSGRRVTVLADAHEAFAHLCVRSRDRRSRSPVAGAGLLLIVDELDAMTMGALRQALEQFLRGTSMWRWDGSSIIPIVDGSTDIEDAPPVIETSSGFGSCPDEDDERAGSGRPEVSGDELEMLLGMAEEDVDLPGRADDPDEPQPDGGDPKQSIGGNEPGDSMGRMDDGGSSSS